MASTNLPATLPETCKALWVEGPGQTPQIKMIPTPQPGPGSVVVKIIAVQAGKNMGCVIYGTAQGMNPPYPYIPGGRLVGRVAAVGPDALTLTPGQLVLGEPFVVGRDAPHVGILLGGTALSGAQSKKLSEYWRDGGYAEYTLIPLENVWPVNETILCGPASQGGLGYSPEDLVSLTRSLVTYGGWRSVDLQAGETVVVTPSTGQYGGGAVEVATAMGARVIAASRNATVLARMKATIPGLETLTLTGDVHADAQAMRTLARGPIDVFMDISPPAVTNPTHITSGLLALRPHGRMSLMGFIQQDVSIPYALIVLNSIRLQGRLMYEPEHVRAFIKLAESGRLKLGAAAGNVVKAAFSLDEWEKALDVDEAWGDIVLIKP